MRRVARVLAVGALVLACGCQKAIFTPDEPRSQFDRVQAVRDKRVPSHVMDEYGNKRPNVRGRLLSVP